MNALFLHKINAEEARTSTFKDHNRNKDTLAKLTYAFKRNTDVPSYLLKGNAVDQPNTTQIRLLYLFVYELRTLYVAVWQNLTLVYAYFTFCRQSWQDVEHGGS